MKPTRPGLACLLVCFSMGACESDDKDDASDSSPQDNESDSGTPEEPSDTSADDTSGSDTSVGDTSAGDTSAGDTSAADTATHSSARFAAHLLPESLHDGGYIDSTFINKSGDRFYFIHSVFSPSVLSGQSSPKHCDHVQAELLPGHITTDGLEWNTDIYYVEWDGESWSEPINLGEPINSLGMECCMWLNDDETEIIYNTVSNLDGDEEDEDGG